MRKNLPQGVRELVQTSNNGVPDLALLRMVPGREQYTGYRCPAFVNSIGYTPEPLCEVVKGETCPTMS